MTEKWDEPTLNVDSRLWVALEGPDEVWLGKLAFELSKIGVRARLAKLEDQSTSGRHPTIVVKCGYPEMGRELGPDEVAPLEADPMIWFPGKDGAMVSLRADRHLGVLAMEIARFVRRFEDEDDDTLQDDLLQARVRDFQQRANAPRPRPAPSFAVPPSESPRVPDPGTKGASGTWAAAVVVGLLAGVVAAAAAYFLS